MNRTISNRVGRINEYVLEDFSLFIGEWGRILVVCYICRVSSGTYLTSVYFSTL